MSWGQIKHAINDRLDIPLNRQKNSHKSQVLTVGGAGDSNIITSELRIDGPGHILGISRPTHPTGAAVLSIILDDETVVGDLTLAAGNNVALTTSPATGGFHFVGNTGLPYPLSFSRNALVRIQRTDANPLALINATVRFEIGEISHFSTSNQAATFRRLTFNATESVQITTPIRGNTAQLHIIGRGGDSPGGTVMSGQHGMPGRFETASFAQNGEIVQQTITLQQNDIISSNFLPDGAVQFIRNGAVVRTAQRGANASLPSPRFLQDGHHQGGPIPVPTGIFAGAGVRGGVNGSGPTTPVPNVPITLPTAYGLSGRVVLEFDVI